MSELVDVSFELVCPDVLDLIAVLPLREVFGEYREQVVL